MLSPKICIGFKNLYIWTKIIKIENIATYESSEVKNCEFFKLIFDYPPQYAKRLCNIAARQAVICMTFE